MGALQLHMYVPRAASLHSTQDMQKQSSNTSRSVIAAASGRLHTQLTYSGGLMISSDGSYQISPVDLNQKAVLKTEQKSIVTFLTRVTFWGVASTALSALISTLQAATTKIERVRPKIGQ
jgi:hypothetical protein